MLCALDHRRPTRFVGDVQETFDAQKSWSEVLRNSVQQELRLLARQGAFARENETLDAPAFEMVTVRMAGALVLLMTRAAVTSVMVVCGVLIGLHVEPGARIRLRVRRVEAPRRKEFGDIRGRPINLVNFGGRGNPTQLESDARRSVLSVAGNHVEFRNPDLVGERDLSNSLFVRLRRSGPIDGIHEREHARNTVEPVQRWLREERLKDRTRLRQARCLDHDIAERRNLAGLSGMVKRVERADQIASNSAAKAAIFEHDHGIGTAREKLVVKTNLAKLVDHDNRLRKFFGAQRGIDQSRLSASEKPSDKGHRDPTPGHGSRAFSGHRGPWLEYFAARKAA